MESAEHRAAEAERLIKEPLLVAALADLESRLMEELLSGPASGEVDADKWRRNRIDSINAVRAIPQAIRAALYQATADLRERGGRA